MESKHDSAWESAAPLVAAKSISVPDIDEGSATKKVCDKPKKMCVGKRLFEAHAEEGVATLLSTICDAIMLSLPRANPSIT